MTAPVLLHRRPGLDWESFSRYFRAVHGPLARHPPGPRYYAQQHTREAFFGDLPPGDGMAELWFDRRESLRTAFGSPAGRVAPADGLNFLDDASSGLVVGEDQYPAPGA